MFFRKREGFFKNIEFYPKSLKVANLLYNAYQMVSFLKNVFRPIYEVFLQRNQKILNVGKIGNYDEKKMFFEKKNRFPLFKSLLHKIGKAQMMPVVAGSLVFF